MLTKKKGLCPSSPPPFSPRSWLGADPSALALLLYTHSLGNGLVPPTTISPLLCPPLPQGASLPSLIIWWALSVLGTSRRRLSGPRPQNAEVPRFGHCVSPRHTGFGLSLARVAAPTPAACSPPVAYGVRPVPAPCDHARPCVFDTALRRVSPPHPIYLRRSRLRSRLTSPENLALDPFRVQLLSSRPSSADATPLFFQRVGQP